MLKFSDLDSRRKAEFTHSRGPLPAKTFKLTLQVLIAVFPLIKIVAGLYANYND